MTFGKDQNTKGNQSWKLRKTHGSKGGKRGGVLNAHHIVPWVISKDNSMDNLITLCVPCHSKIHQLNRDEKGRWRKN